MSTLRTRLNLALLCLLSATACSELRARSRAREGNELYREGEYAAAARAFVEAEQLHPGLPVVALNHGLACRQLMLPGSHTPSSEQAADCALAAFARLRQLAADDPRGEQLYVQTMFDAERYRELAEMYGAQLAEQPDNLRALNGLIQVYSNWDRPAETLHWLRERAKRQPQDPEAQYAVGVSIFSRLFRAGGGADKAAYDPRGGASPEQTRPLFSVDDIVGKERAELAAVGIAHLQRAIALRPAYQEAFVYLNLLYRQKSFAYFDQPEAWFAAVEAAERYRAQAGAPDSAHAAAR